MSKRIVQSVTGFLKDDSGMETLEYAIIAALVAAAAVLVYASGWATRLQTRLMNATNAE